MLGGAEVGGGQPQALPSAAPKTTPYLGFTNLYTQESEVTTCMQFLI